MHVLVGLLLVVGLLYWWLIGDWFARVLVFLLIFAGLFLLDCILFAAPDGKAAAIVILPILGFSAWGIASLPTYSQRRRSY